MEDEYIVTFRMADDTAQRPSGVERRGDGLYMIRAYGHSVPDIMDEVGNILLGYVVTDMTVAITEAY